MYVQPAFHNDKMGCQEFCWDLELLTHLFDISARFNYEVTLSKMDSILNVHYHHSFFAVD